MKNFVILVVLSIGGDKMLNHDASFIQVGYLTSPLFNFESLPEYIFVKPDYDDKLFAGEIMTKELFLKWLQNLPTNVDEDTVLLISTPKKILREWRIFMTEDKVIAASLYKQNNVLRKQNGCPGYVEQFAIGLARQWTPTQVYCLDIAETEDDFLKCVELTCFNSAGTYGIDVTELMRQVSNYVMLGK
jgi:hypothetical protein